MDLAQRRAGRATRPFPYAAVGIGCLVLASVVCWSSVLLLVMGQVVPAWAVGVTLSLIALVLLRVHVARAGSAVEQPLTLRQSSQRRFGYALLSILAVGSTAFSALGDLGAEYLVLRPTGPDGCTAVVRETAFLFAGSGEVYGVDGVDWVGSTGVAWGPSGSWTADDGYRPVAAGTYELKWHRDGGTLLVSGTSADPVYPGLHDIDCG